MPSVCGSRDPQSVVCAGRAPWGWSQSECLPTGSTSPGTRPPPRARVQRGEGRSRTTWCSLFGVKSASVSGSDPHMHLSGKLGHPEMRGATAAGRRVTAGAAGLQDGSGQGLPCLRWEQAAALGKALEPGQQVGYELTVAGDVKACRVSCPRERVSFHFSIFFS